MTRNVTAVLLVLAACKKPAPVVDAVPEAAAPPPVASVRDELPIARPSETSPFVLVATFADGVTPNAYPLGDAIAVAQYGPNKWTLSAIGARHERVDVIARIPPPMRPLDEQPMFIGGTGIDDVWISTATTTLRVTPRETTSRTGHILTMGLLGGGSAALFLDGEERSLGWLVAPGATDASSAALPKLPPAHRLSDDVTFIDDRICGRSELVVWSSSIDGTRKTTRLDLEHRDAHVYRGPGGECMLHHEGDDGTEVGRLRGDTIAWTKIAPSRVAPVSATRSGSLVVAMGDELVRVSLVNDRLTLTGIPLPDDAKRVSTLVAIDDDDVWFTGPRGGKLEALFHSRPSRGDAGAPATWPVP
ncbi:MAG: hypothetical protein KIT84_41660 [Labilithrix sp.]|nr:hypothetical protein [Labilithrix sp.]MCW5817580.1 hypothetical protein [Labilithrix sp.]